MMRKKKPVMKYATDKCHRAGGWKYKGVEVLIRTTYLEEIKYHQSLNTESKWCVVA